MSPSRLAQLTSRGALVNFVFTVGLQALVAVQGVLVARLLGPGNIGLFGLAMGGVAIGLILKDLGIAKKLVQERDVDLYTSYSMAFTLEVVLAAAFLLVVLGIAPLLAIVYHRPQLWLLTSVLGFTIFTTAFLDLPAALPYREMRFVRSNLFSAIGPVTAFAVTVPTAYLGWGVWSLVAGNLAGFAMAAIVLLFASPIRPHLLWEPILARRYLTFGWPIWLGQLLAAAAGWGAVFVVSGTIGIAGLGYFQLAQSWAQRALQVDSVLSDAVFPALCSIQSSLARFRRAFVITNRLSLLWAAPVGIGIVLFAAPAVHLLLGPRWSPAVVLVQAEGAGIVVNSIGYNWDVFFAARGQTRPQLTVSLFAVGWLVAVVIPLLEVFGIRGAAVAILILAVASYLVRQWYLRRLFGPFTLALVVWREVLAALLAAGGVGAARLAGWRVHDLAGLFEQGIFFLVLCTIAGLITSRAIVREAVAALRARERAQEGAERSPASARPSPNTSTPRAMAFPLSVTHDASANVVWVTTRDWPAVGRLELWGRRWTWTELPSFPHVATPDGRGGCWTALTRSSAVAHVDPSGAIRLVTLEPTRELLVTVRHAGAVWVVDGHRRGLVRVDEMSTVAESIALGDGMARPDFVAVAPHGMLWVGDTQEARIAVVNPWTAGVTHLRAPHPTRALLADATRHGVWLGASDARRLSLLGAGGDTILSIDLPDIPFGTALTADGRVIVALKGLDALAVVEPETGRVELIELGEAAGPMGCASVGNRCFVTLAGVSEIAELTLPAKSPPY